MSAPGLSAANANLAAAAATGTNAAYAGLNTGEPGSAGTSNTSSVTTRESVSWGSASGGVIAASNEPEWTSWAGTNGESVGYITLWSLSSSGTFGLSMALGSAVTMDTGDSLTLTEIQLTIPVAS